MAKEITLNESEIETVLTLFQYETVPIENSSHVKIKAKLQRALKKEPIKVSSRKAKGRNLQKWAVEKIAELICYKLPENKDESHIRSREMGQAGVDVVLSNKARQRFPFAVECKNQEKINIAEFMKQAKSNKTEYTRPLLIVKNKTLKEPVIIMEWDTFSALYNCKNISKYYPLD